MALVQITPHLRELARLEPGAFGGTTVAEVIDNLCLAHLALRSYVLDDQGRLRKHITIFVEGDQLRGAEVLARNQKFTPEIQDPHRLVQNPADPKTFWAQHHNGIFVTSDDLANWQETHKAAPSTFGFAVATHPKNAQTAWFVPAIKDEYRYPVDGKLVVTRPRVGGQSFEIITQGLPQAHCYDLIYRHGLDVDESGQRLAMGSTTGNLWTSENEGDSWQHISAFLPPIYAVRFAS